MRREQSLWKLRGGEEAMYLLCSPREGTGELGGKEGWEGGRERLWRGIGIRAGAD